MTEQVPLSVHLRKLMKEKHVTQRELASAMDVARETVNRLCNDQCNLTIELALKLEKVLEVEAEQWLIKKLYYDIEQARMCYEEELSLLQPIRSEYANNTGASGSAD